MDMHKIFLTILIIGFTILNANATTSVIYNSAGQPIGMRNFSANPFPNIYRRQILPPNPPNLNNGYPPPQPRYRYPRVYSYYPAYNSCSSMCSYCPYDYYPRRCQRNTTVTKKTTAAPISRFDKRYQTSSSNKIVTCNGITYYGSTNACQ